MGRVQDIVYAADAGIGTAAQALNIGGYLATNGFDNPIRLVVEGGQMANNGFQLYQGLRNNGGIHGIADNPELYEADALVANTVNGFTSAYDLTRVPARFRQIREMNEEDPSRFGGFLRYLAAVGGVVADALNVIDAGLRISRALGADF